MPDLDYDLLTSLLASGPTPVFATVSGAHLYGFASPDSDVDLRGAYVLPLREVLGLKAPRETLTITSYPGEIELDWVAHDIVKFARMMTQRNGYVLEQLYSPLVVAGGTWLDRLRDIGQGFFISNLYYHYRGFFLNQRKLLVRSEPSVKALLYAYRVVFTGIHLLQTGEMESNLTRLQQIFSRHDLDELVARKQHGHEHGDLEPGELALHESPLDALGQALDQAWKTSRLPRHPPPSTQQALNDYVIDVRLALGSPPTGEPRDQA